MSNYILMKTDDICPLSLTEVGGSFCDSCSHNEDKNSFYVKCSRPNFEGIFLKENVKCIIQQKEE